MRKGGIQERQVP
jgi:hypothetical protein